MSIVAETVASTSDELDPGKALARLMIPATTGGKKMSKSFDAGRMRWCPDAKDYFVPCEIVSVKGAESVVKLIGKSEKRTVKSEHLQEMNPPRYDNCEDMANLTHLNDASVIHNLRSRYMANLIYTYSGLFCVAVNPYCNLPIYDVNIMSLYRKINRTQRPPHIFAITDHTYISMLREKENQSILITGESGSGKTENTKKVIQYFAYVGSSAEASISSAQSTTTTTTKSNLEDQIISANPLLESYGNAKTIRNDNSSRFGKFIQIHFNGSGKIAGANIDTYLLEKSRVSLQNTKERNYHIFYQLLSGAIPELKEKILLEGRDVSDYVYVGRGAIKADTIDDAEDMLRTDRAIEIMGFSEEERMNMYKITGAVLIFGNSKWKQRGREEQAESDGTTECEKVAYLLGVDVGDFLKCLLRPRIKVGSEYVNRGQSKDQVLYTVGALSKSIYQNLFSWIVQRVNDTLAASSKRKYFIGVLDIAGFEIFEQNSFEQLCINYTNEKLQQFFNHHMFVLEQEEYRTEKIPWEFIDFGLDLQPCIDLIEKPMGIFAILEEECIIPKATDASFLTKLLERHAEKHPNLKKHKGTKNDSLKGHFDIQHYAGNVAYNTDGWLEKNKDPGNVSVGSLFKNSKNQMMALLYKESGDEGGSSGKARKMGSMRTISAVHKEQLNRLINILTRTHPHFVRCILPNEQKKSGVFDVQLVLQQLHCNGVLEGIRICRKGYPNRMLFSEFKRSYSILAANAIPKGYVDGIKVTEIILETIGMSKESFKLGETKVFFKSGMIGTIEALREKALSDIVARFQAHIRRFIVQSTYDHLCKRRLAVEILQTNCRTYLGFRNWNWWRLYTKLKPLLTVARQEEAIAKLQEDYSKLKSLLEKETALRMSIENEAAQLMKEKDSLQAQLDINKALLNTADDRAKELLIKQTDLENQLKELDNTNSDQENEINSLKLALKMSDSSRAENENEIKHLSVAVRELQVELKVKCEQNNDLDEKVRNLLAQVDKLNVEIASRDKELMCLSEEKQSLVQENRQLNKLKSKNERTLRELEENIRQSGKMANELKNELTQSNCENERLMRRLNEVEDEKRRTNKQIDEKDAMLTHLKNQLDVECSQLSSEREFNRKLKEEHEDLKETLSELQYEIVQVENQKTILSDELSVLSNNLKEKDDILSEEKESGKRRDKEFQLLRVEADGMREKFGRLEVEWKRRFDSIQNDSRVKEDQLVAFKKKMENMRKSEAKKLDDLKKQLDQQIELKESAEAKWKQAAFEVLEKQSLIVESERLIEENKKLIIQQNSALAEAKSAADARNDDIAQLRNTQQRLIAESSEALAECEQVVAEKTLLEKTKRSLEQQLNELANSNESLSYQLEQTQIALKRVQDQSAASHLALQSELQAKLSDMDEQKREIQSTLVSKCSDLEEREAKLCKLTNENSNLKRETNKLNLALDRANEQVSKLEKREKQLERSEQALRANSNTLSLRLEALSTWENEQKLSHARLENEVEMKKAEVERMCKESEALKGRLIEMEMRRDVENERQLCDFEKLLRAKEAEMEEKERAEDEHLRAIQRLTEELTLSRRRIEDEIKSHAIQLNELRKEYEARIEQKCEQCDGVTRAKDELFEEKTELMRLCRKLEDECEIKNLEISGLKGKLDKNQGNVKSLADELRQSEAEKAAHVSRLESEVGRVRELSNEVKTLKAKLSSGSVRRESVVVARVLNKKSEEEELNVLRKANVSLQEERAEIERRLANTIDEFEEARIEFAGCKQENSKLREELLATKDESRKQKSACDKLIASRTLTERKLKEQVDELKEQSVQRERESVRMRETNERKLHQALIELESMKARYAETNKSLKSANKRLKDAQVKYSESEKNIGTLNEQIAQLQRRMQVYREQIEESDKNAAINLAKYKKASAEMTLAVEKAESVQNRLSRIRARSRSNLSNPFSNCEDGGADGGSQSIPSE